MTSGSGVSLHLCSTAGMAAQSCFSSFTPKCFRTGALDMLTISHEKNDMSERRIYLGLCDIPASGSFLPLPPLPLPLPLFFAGFFAASFCGPFAAQST